MAMPSELQRHPDIARELQPNLDSVPASVVTLVRRGVQGGEIDRADAGRIVQMYIACLLGLTHFAVIFGPEEGTRATWAFTDLLEGGLLPRTFDQAREEARQAKGLVLTQALRVVRHARARMPAIEVILFDADGVLQHPSVDFRAALALVARPTDEQILQALRATKSSRSSAARSRVSATSRRPD